MADQKIPIQNAASIADLESECNFIELNLPGRLKSLKAEENDGNKVTQATFDRLPDVEDGLGNVKLKKDDAGTNSAWIRRVNTKVSFTRGS